MLFFTLYFIACSRANSVMPGLGLHQSVRCIARDPTYCLHYRLTPPPAGHFHALDEKAAANRSANCLLLTATATEAFQPLRSLSI